MAILYQFPISHYCEKARWTLDFKGVPFEIKNLLVGFHYKKLKSMAADTTVPVVVHQATTIQGSDKIIDYLDQQISENSLTPDDPELARQSREWEAYAAKHFGDPIRCILYDILLEHPNLLIPRFAYGGPWYSKLLYKAIYSQLKQKVRVGLRINDKSVGISKKLVERGMNKLASHVRQREFVVGGQFSRADLTVCSLLSPLLGPPGSPYANGISSMPEAILQYRDSIVDEDVMQWVSNIYKNHRHLQIE